MTYAEMKRILIYCQLLGFEGLQNGKAAIIPPLEINLQQRNAFLGAPGNPAIFVSDITYKKLKNFHADWIPNITIAISRAYVFEPKTSSIDIIGVLIHESGHAFNVYAKIPNTEANAYVFEIETMVKLFNMRVLTRQFGLSKEDVDSYFKSRMDQYTLEINNNAFLKKLVDDLPNILEPQNNQAIKLPQVTKIQIKLSFFKQNKPEEQYKPEKQDTSENSLNPTPKEDSERPSSSAAVF